MDRTALTREVDAWSAADPDEGTRAELQRLLAAGAFAELEDRFAGQLEFGTAGLRGVVGAGPNRMNRAVVRRATAGLAAHLLATVPGRRPPGRGRRPRRAADEPRVRRGHRAVLAAAGIPALVRDGFTPTPLCAFAVERLGAAAGVMVTASHNPPEYNGYKVYWGNGAQIIPPHDVGIAAAIARVGPAREIPLADLAAARAHGTRARASARSSTRHTSTACSRSGFTPARGPTSPSSTRRCTGWAAPGARGASARRVFAGPSGPGAARARSGVPHRALSRTPRRRARWICRARSPSARGPTSCSPTIPTPIGSPCCPRAPRARCARSPATRSACCSGTTCSRRARSASGPWS